jgi:hypothetical protein
MEYFRLKRRIGEAEQTLAQKRKEITHLDDYTSGSGKDTRQ